jgi:hypothetical protein
VQPALAVQHLRRLTGLPVVALEHDRATHTHLAPAAAATDQPQVLQRRQNKQLLARLPVLAQAQQVMQDIGFADYGESYSLSQSAVTLGEACLQRCSAGQARQPGPLRSKAAAAPHGRSCCPQAWRC